MKEFEKIIARMLFFMHQSILRPDYIFNNNAYFLEFHAQKISLIFLFISYFFLKKPCILEFLIMKSNINKAPFKC